MIIADELISHAAYIGTPGNESTGKLVSVWTSINIENIESNRRALREQLFTAPWC